MSQDQDLSQDLSQEAVDGYTLDTGLPEWSPGAIAAEPSWVSENEAAWGADATHLHDAEYAPAEQDSQAVQPSQLAPPPEASPARPDDQTSAELLRLASQNAQYETAIRAVVPVVQQAVRDQAAARARAAEPTDEQLEQAGYDPQVYDQVRSLIDRENATREQARDQALRASMQQAAVAEEARREVEAVAGNAATFMQEKQIARGSEMDARLGTFLQQLDQASARAGLAGLDLSDREWLDVAFEAVQSPNLARILLANPAWGDDPETLDLARQQAGLLQGAKPGKARGADGRFVSPSGASPLPHVARGGSVSPQSGSRVSNDPLADAKALVAAEEANVF